MQRNGKHRVRTNGQKQQTVPWKTAAWGVLLAWIATLVMILLSSVLFYTGWLSGSSSQYQTVVYIIMILSLLIGVIYVSRKTQGKDRIWIIGMLAGYLIVRFLLGAILTFL